MASKRIMLMMTDLVEIVGDIKWVFWADKDGLWKAECAELKEFGVITEDTVFSDLLSAMCTVTNVFFQHLYEDGKLESFLDERGWWYACSKPLDKVNPDFLDFDVSFNVIRKGP